MAKHAIFFKKYWPEVASPLASVAEASSVGGTKFGAVMKTANSKRTCSRQHVITKVPIKNTCSEAFISASHLSPPLISLFLCDAKYF